jgi:hypothetical protein
MPSLTAAMPTKTERRAGPLYQRAVSNIERMLSDLGIDQKELCLAIRMAEPVFSSKKLFLRSHFYEDEFEQIADFFRRKTNRPLIGFPHLEWSMMLACDRQVGGWSPKNH